MIATRANPFILGFWGWGKAKRCQVTFMQMLQWKSHCLPLY